MSIRLRLTLLYSTILALTLIVFGIVLYSIQAQDTLNSLKRDISMSSQKLVDSTLKTGAATAPPLDNIQRPPPPPQPFDEFTTEQVFQVLPEQEIARVLDANGSWIASPFGREEDALPLSEEGLAALQSGQDWWQTSTVSGDSMLIYSRPIIQNSETVFIIQVARSLAERTRTLQTLATTLGGAGLLTILVAFGAGWMLSRFTLRPIHRITQTAETIGSERDFTRRVDYHGPQDEIGRLANTFNQMLSRLQDAYQKVGHSLEMQRNFVADVSHELRTPLTTLRGNLGLLKRDPPAPPEEQADILTDMVDESDRLIRLVNDLLTFARAETGRSLAKEPVAIGSLFAEAIRQAHQLDESRQISTETSSDLNIIGDRDAVKQVLLILLDNALKHSDGEISLSAVQTNGQVEIRLQDHGRGMSPEQLEHIFDRFYRCEDAVSQGVGLGLSIAKTIVENMDGTISVESELGRGSTVIIRLHAAQAGPQ